MSTAEQDAAATAAVKDDDDDDNVEAELFGEDEDNDNDGPATSAPVDSKAKAEDAPSFSIPKKESSAGGGEGTPTGTAATATASAATTPSLASPTKHDDDGASPKRKLSNGGGGSLELPDEVVVPDSAKQIIASDRSNRLKALLLKLPVDQMSAALEEYDEAIQQQKPIRNHIGYLTGVLKRYLSIQERTSRPGDGAGAMGEMTAAVKGLIQTKLFDTGFCTEIDLDEKLTAKLKQLPEREAMAAIEEISRCDRSSIRNFPSYFMGILHRYMRGERDSALSGPGGAVRGGADGPHYGGRRPPHHHDNHHRGGGPPPSHHRGPDRYGGGRDDRDSRYGRGFDDRGRDRSPYGDRRGGRYERDRSPEYDRRRNDHHRDRVRERDRYGDRRDRDRDRSPDGYYGGGRSRRRYSSRSRSRSRSPSDSRSPYGRERKYSRDEGSNAARRESRWGSSSSSAAPPGASQQGFSQYGPSGPSGGTSSWGTSPPQRQQPLGTRVFAPAPAPVAPPTATGYYGQQPPVGMAPPMAAPAMGAYGPATTAVPTGAAPYGQIPGVPPPAPAAVPTGIPGVDLASLASQAQQALSTIQYQPQPAVEVVTESDLPLMVQYSLTNLKTTGHIDPAGLDPGVCRMLKNVPEHIALSALEKFQSCDTSLMRNKNSYLAGIIKRKREESGY